MPARKTHRMQPLRPPPPLERTRDSIDGFLAWLLTESVRGLDPRAADALRDTVEAMRKNLDGSFREGEIARAEAVLSGMQDERRAREAAALAARERRSEGSAWNGDPLSRRNGDGKA